MRGADSWDAGLRSRSEPRRLFANFHERDAKIEEKASGDVQWESQMCRACQEALFLCGRSHKSAFCIPGIHRASFSLFVLIEKIIGGCLRESELKPSWIEEEQIIQRF
jgi:hypothetical protein